MNETLTYRQLYFDLFRSLNRATDALDSGEVFRARAILITAMQAAEEAHMNLDLLPKY